MATCSPAFITGLRIATALNKVGYWPMLSALSPATTPPCVASGAHVSSITVARCLQAPDINQSVVNIILVAIAEQVDAKHLFSVLCA